jgi:hypothetical protein
MPDYWDVQDCVPQIIRAISSLSPHKFPSNYFRTFSFSLLIDFKFSIFFF